MKIRSRFLDKIIAWTAFLFLRALFLTVRVDIRMTHSDGLCTVRPQDRQRYCFPVWHDAILIALFCHRSYSLSALVSRHQDGTYLSDVLNLLGIRPVRGSTSRGGAQATKQLLEMSDQHICITPDGPRGPRRQMKDGIIFVASKTRRPVICTAMKATRAWYIPGNWSDMVLPKPFSKVIVLAGKSIHVSEDLSREQIASYRTLVQDEMDLLDAVAERIICGDESASHLVGPDSKGTASSGARQAA